MESAEPNRDALVGAPPGVPPDASVQRGGRAHRAHERAQGERHERGPAQARGPSRSRGAAASESARGHEGRREPSATSTASIAAPWPVSPVWPVASDSTRGSQLAMRAAHRPRGHQQRHAARSCARGRGASTSSSDQAGAQREQRPAREAEVGAEAERRRAGRCGRAQAGGRRASPAMRAHSTRPIALRQPIAFQ